MVDFIIKIYKNRFYKCRTRVLGVRSDIYTVYIQLGDGEVGWGRGKVINVQ